MTSEYCFETIGDDGITCNGPCFEKEHFPEQTETCLQYCAPLIGNNGYVGRFIRPDSTLFRKCLFNSNPSNEVQESESPRSLDSNPPEVK